jgi:hypothetical protein
VPIGSTFGGDDICLAVRGRIGAVFHTAYTYKTVGRGDLVPIDVAMEPLAGSFTEFLDLLTEIPDPYCHVVDLGRRGTVEDLRRYVAEGNSINALGKNKRTVLCEAIVYNNLPMVRACIERGAGLSGTIDAAVGAHQTHLIEMLVKAGADVNERDEHGFTPLSGVGGWDLPGKEGARNRGLRDLLIKLGAHK